MNLFVLIVLIIISLIESSFEPVLSARAYSNSTRRITTSEFKSVFKLTEESILVEESSKGPPSYTILMNFQNDGTTSLQIFSENNIYYNDKGLCNHGQLYDTNINQCRDIFCTEGFIFTKDGCKPDPHFNKTHMPPPIPDRLKLEVTLLNKICSLEANLKYNCSNDYLMNDTIGFENEFKNVISTKLEINKERILNFTILNSDVINQTLNTFERINFTFIFKDNKDYPDDKEELVNLYYTLVKISMDYSIKLELFKKEVIIANVTEIKSDKDGWCQLPDHPLNIKKNFSILASFDDNNKATYYVWVEETDRIYGTGDFYLSIFNTPLKQAGLLRDLSDFQDITNVVLNGNDSIINTILTVCNRAPKLEHECPGYLTIRLSKCEFINYLNDTICHKMKNICFTHKQYEYDRENPNEFIRVCKYDPNTNETYFSQSFTQQGIKTKDESTTAGYVSFISNAISIAALIATLITYALFNELRNIPGWNCINLASALCLAQISFLAGSLVIQSPIQCLISALLTHYGFLATFFWMNIIAFDLYRNFRKNIPIYTLSVRHRLLRYALFAWGLPLILVTICLIIDATYKSPFKHTAIKPCYGGFFDGCQETSSIYRIPNFDNNLVDESFLNMFNKDCPLLANTTSNLTEDSVRICWIQNGNANLIYFGTPIGIIILINAVFYSLTVYNIRKKKLKQKKQRIRRFSRSKCPGDDDVKFYMRMAVIMGFTWIIGFFFATFPSKTKEFQIVKEILSYIFILCNASMGVSIFFVFIFKREIKNMYVKLMQKKFGTKKEVLSSISNSMRQSNETLDVNNSDHPIRSSQITFQTTQPINIPQIDDRKSSLSPMNETRFSFDNTSYEEILKIDTKYLRRADNSNHRDSTSSTMILSDDVFVLNPESLIIKEEQTILKTNF